MSIFREFVHNDQYAVMILRSGQTLHKIHGNHLSSMLWYRQGLKKARIFAPIRFGLMTDIAIFYPVLDSRLHVMPKEKLFDPCISDREP